MVDSKFGNPTLALVYDELEGERPDLEHYGAIVAELGAGAVLDVGCGTGTFACILAARGYRVAGVDPAQASLDVATKKMHGDQVRWFHGDATALPPLQVDVAVMTGNVAQVFLSDQGWHDTLTAIRSALRPGGYLVFEVRDPAYRGWSEWTRAQSLSQIHRPGGGSVTSWVDLTEVGMPYVSFRWTYVLEPDRHVLTSHSTLRFRSRSEIEMSLVAAGFDLLDVRDAPDRPNREFVFIATRPDS